MQCEVFSSRFVNWTRRSERSEDHRTGPSDGAVDGACDTHARTNERRAVPDSRWRTERKWGPSGCASRRAALSRGRRTRVAPLLQRLLPGDRARSVAKQRGGKTCGDPQARGRSCERDDNVRRLRPVAQPSVTTQLPVLVVLAAHAGLSTRELSSQPTRTMKKAIATY